MPATAVIPMTIPSSSTTRLHTNRVPTAKPAIASLSKSTAAANVSTKTAVAMKSSSMNYPAISPSKPPTMAALSAASTASTGRVSLSPAAAAAAMSSSSALTGSKKKDTGGLSTEVPIFLQKTYHMIDTCDPKICSWSEDGITFVVKDTILFESTIIPQFFKHNKFSSFVRQLNFYGFRKIKYCDSLRIDPQLEAETANYWRFKHDKFRQGRRDLLIEIKRSSGSNSTQSNVPAAPTTTTSLSASAKVLPAPVTSSAVVVATSVPQILQARANEKPEDVTHLKTEVQELKQRIASITKNVDELTCLVKNISVSDNEVNHNNKRKKTEPVKLEQVVMEDLPMPDWNPSSSDVLGGVDDASGLPFPSLLSAPLPEMVTSRETSISSNVSDEGFVDDLFQAFVDEDVSMGISALDEVEVGSASNSSSPSTENTPDPKLMKRIEDSLATLPKDIHEMVANRFIQAIVITEPIAKPVSHPPHTGSAAENIASVPKETRRSSAIVDTEVSQPPVPIAHCNSSSSLTSAVEVPTGPTIPLPLAIATLRTILAEHGVSVECHRAKDAAMSRRMNNTIPVVPVHA